MGLKGELIESVSAIVQKMYQLLIQKDLDLVEINPLGINSTDEVMALDGKIAVNDNALGRHAELVTLASTLSNSGQFTPARNDYNSPGVQPIPQTHSSVIVPQPIQLKWTDTEGNIGILCNSTCLAAATLDLVYQAKGKPGSCLIVDGYASWDLPSLSSPIQQLQNGLKQMTETQGIQVVLVNILSSAAASEAVAEVIANYLRSKVGEMPMLSTTDRTERPTGALSRAYLEHNKRNSSVQKKSASASRLPHFVIRIVGGKIGGKIEATKHSLASLPVHWIDNLDQAVEQTLSLAKLALKKS
ncbi:MAG TPA: hypothetical protein DCL61_09840 [Cyanobacteria bacterium UBA12227]|nr:hypothetical protein [Cyanobacteria bacterium UBA12227]